MKKTVEALKAEIIKERINLESEAFEIYCKRELKYQMQHVKEAEEDLKSKNKRMESLTIDRLKEDFNKFSMNIMDSPKEQIIKEILSKGPAA